MNMPCRHEVELRQFERMETAQEVDYETKLSMFREDPYSYCEWNIDAFSKTDLLQIALEALLPDFDEMAWANFCRANGCARKDALAAIEGSVQKVEL